MLPRLSCRKVTPKLVILNQQAKIKMAEKNQPINASAYDDNENEDRGLWKVGNDYYSISEMSNDFLETSFYHCLKKIGSHSERIKKSLSSLKKFEEKSREIYQEMKSRNIHDRVNDTPQDALRKALGDKINLSNGKASQDSHV